MPAWELNHGDPNAKPQPTYLTPEKLPMIRHIAKSNIDKERSRKLLTNIAKLVEDITTRNYEFQEKSN